MNHKNNKRSSFSGKIGFVLSAAGASVGLGNIWRFPYLAAAGVVLKEPPMVPIAVRHALAMTTFFAIFHSSDIRCFHLIYGLKMIVKFLSFPTQLLYHRVFIFAMDSLPIYIFFIFLQESVLIKNLCNRGSLINNQGLVVSGHGFLRCIQGAQEDIEICLVRIVVGIT